jgi:transposase
MSVNRYDHLRELVLGALDEGRSISEVHRLYKVSRPTIYRWVERRDGGEPLVKPKGRPKGSGTGPRKGNDKALDTVLDDAHERLTLEFKRYLRQGDPELSRYMVDKLALDRQSFLLWFSERITEKIREGFVFD